MRTDAASAALELGVHTAVGAPITVKSRPWGLIVVASTTEEPPPRETEARLGDFTELVAIAIANADAQAELTASRARIVAAGDQARQRFERDLHDGTQQRLVSLALELRTAQAVVPPELTELSAQLDRRCHVCDRLAGRAARDHARHSPGDPYQGRTGRGAARARPPLPDPRPPRPARTAAATPACRGQRLLRRRRGAD